ncbi:hypothetical protein CDO45_02100 [Pseudomonas aeruginosa]|uniref:DUF4376 domain-containing protein n=1 Tax=Pseudomonas aeruginosa TaxID=287 RepID=UPI000B413B85|nr:hypothetical protein [Pseudomonas aeruginosa]OVZ20494.1 hypothetical protein CDO45_02100 [Pseudomonas aeruginosa]
MIKVNSEKAKAIVRARFKRQRADAVAAITVTTARGWTFDGDEQSQTRMARSIASMEDGETITWVLADNSPADVTREELREALRLAGASQAALWVADGAAQP